MLASDHEARALERGEALPAANQRARRQRLSLGTLDWRSPAENRPRPLLDAAFLQAGLLPDPAAAEEPQRLLERPSERQRQRPSLPPEPQPPEEFDERVERFPSTRAFLAARRLPPETATLDRRARRLAGTGRRPGGGGGCRVPSPARRADARGGVVPPLCLGAAGRRFQVGTPSWRVDGNWLVLHRRSLAERSELLLSSVSGDGSLLWTLELPIERPERLFRLDAHNLLLSGRGEEGGRLVRVDLRRGSGIVHRLGRGGAPLQRVEWPEGQP
ncbi:PA2928 family protein [Pseudomonas aeruginosa]